MEGGGGERGKGGVKECQLNVARWAVGTFAVVHWCSVLSGQTFLCQLRNSVLVQSVVQCVEFGQCVECGQCGV